MCTLSRLEQREYMCPLLFEVEIATTELVACNFCLFIIHNESMIKM